MIIKKIKLNKNSGFVLLFAVVISSIIFAIALGVTSIALKEVKFSSSAKGANDAFFAADTGAECALYWDYNLSIGDDFLGYDEDDGQSWNCAGTELSGISGSPPTWSFVLAGGSMGQSCAAVTITKDPTVGVTIISKGYNVGGDNNCNSTSSNRVERQLEVTY